MNDDEMESKSAVGEERGDSQEVGGTEELVKGEVDEADAIVEEAGGTAEEASGQVGAGVGEPPIDVAFSGDASDRLRLSRRRSRAWACQVQRFWTVRSY